MKLYIKNMVCNRCIEAVRQLAKELHFNIQTISLGELELNEKLNKTQEVLFSERLAKMGFGILDNQKQQLIERIKNIVIKHIHYNDVDKKHNLSSILSQNLNKDYSFLSNLFSNIEGTTIEKFAIAQKVEKVKELIIYDELSLSEIAFKMGYSSVAHLSKQFKKTTGLTPSHFKEVGINKRKPLDKI